MLEFLISNPMIVIAVILVVMLLVISLFFSVKKKKKDKNVDVDKDVSKEGNEETEKPNENSEEKPKLIFKRKRADKEKKLKKAKEKPSVQKIYERAPKKEHTEESAEAKSSISEEELLQKMQFVKSSKKVSKLVKNEDIEELQAVSEVIGDMKDGEESSQISQTLLNLTEQKHGHFDKSRRLHRCIQDNNFDEMFCSHISDSYLNINSDKHLKVDQDFESKLFDRTSKMLANSGAKVLVDESTVDGDVNTSIKVDKNYMKSWLEEKRREELANLISVSNKIEESESEDLFEVKEDEFNARNLILGQVLMSRKKISKSSKH